MKDDLQFTCAACQTDYTGDTSNVRTACRVCKRIHCDDCVDEFGRCVKCAEETSTK